MIGFFGHLYFLGCRCLLSAPAEASSGSDGKRSLLELSPPLLNQSLMWYACLVLILWLSEFLCVIGPPESWAYEASWRLCKRDGKGERTHTLPPLLVCTMHCSTGLLLENRHSHIKVLGFSKWRLQSIKPGLGLPTQWACPWGWAPALCFSMGLLVFWVK